MKRLLLLILAFLLIGLPGLVAQTRTEAAEAEEYTEDEFPQWLRDFRRAEIVALGSLPVTYLFSTLAVDVYRYGNNGFDADYLPAIAGTPTRVDFTDGEKYAILIGAAGSSMAIALIDYLLGLSER